MISFFKKIFGEKNKINDDDILSIFKSINYQIKLVDVVCKRDIKTYNKNSQKISSLMNSDWVFGYIFGITTNFFSNSNQHDFHKEKNLNLFTDVISDVLHMLRVNNSKKSTDHKERIKSFIIESKKWTGIGSRQYLDSDLYKGFQIGMYDYSNFLKISENKKKVDKILMYMKLCHYLCDELNIPRIDERYPKE